MRRRDFLKGALVAAIGSCRSQPGWKALRLVHGSAAGIVERTTLTDAASLLERAIASPVTVVVEGGGVGALDVFVASSEASSVGKPGAFRIHRDPRRLVIRGSDPEGARNGLYRLLEHLGFGFFRDGETIPVLRGAPELDLEIEEEPAFRLRGDRIWDNYLGPRRFCSAMWSEALARPAPSPRAYPSRLDPEKAGPALQVLLQSTLPSARMEPPSLPGESDGRT